MPMRKLVEGCELTKSWELGLLLHFIWQIKKGGDFPSAYITTFDFIIRLHS